MTDNKKTIPSVLNAPSVASSGASITSNTAQARELLGLVSSPTARKSDRDALQELNKFLEQLGSSRATDMPEVLNAVLQDPDIGLLSLLLDRRCVDLICYTKFCCTHRWRNLDCLKRKRNPFVSVFVALLCSRPEVLSPFLRDSLTNFPRSRIPKK